MRSNGSPIAIIAFAVALLVAACATPAPPEEVPPEAQATLPPDAPTDAPGSEPTDLAPSDEEQPPIEYEALLSSEEIEEKLKMASADGVSDPVLVFGDDFSSPGWLEFTEDEFTTSYVDEAYELSVKPGGFSTAFGLNPSLGPLTDFYFQIEARAYGPADNGYGIRFREQEAGFYEFTVSSGGTGSSGEPISSGGTFSIDKFIDFDMVRILPFKTESPSIAQGEGELNVLGVLALGPDISLYVNGQEVASFGDPDHAAGAISLRVLPYFEGGSRTLFDNAAVWVPAD
jgi:hypothetical protein